MTLLVTAGGLGMIGAGAKAWWDAWREDRKAKRESVAAEKAREEERRQSERQLRIADRGLRNEMR